MRLLKIGRAQTCDIVLHSDRVSSLHAELVMLDNGDMQIEDKNSRNGTFIMNQPIQPGKPVNVRRGDAIRFADVELQWSQVPMSEDNSAYKAIYGVGSNFQNDIQISGATVSRYHATIKVGRDNKVYIVDHSKNGTTVDGKKIPSNTPFRIKKSSAVVCGGVPVNLRNQISWPADTLSTLLKIAASLIVVAGLGLGVKTLIGTHDKKYDDGELFARYNRSLVMMIGVYHYNVTVGDMTPEQMALFEIPTKVLLAGDKLLDVSSLSSKDLVNWINEITMNSGAYSGTGFFISEDGMAITNLHVVKPWLYTNAREVLQNLISKSLAQSIATIDVKRTYFRGNATSLSAYISQVKVDGELDYIALVPQGEIFDPDNMIKCRVLSAGDEKEKDVALVQTVSMRLPTSKCTYVNVKDSMDISEEALKVGNHLVTMGFPLGMDDTWEIIQKRDNEKGIQAVSNGGNITQAASEYTFGFNAISTHGASGSPIFNEQGMLIGVLNSGNPETQGYNYGVQAKYIQELLSNPHRK
ncbi:MAG: FHA domain-containing protein [Bacteroidaceae bacterium]|nr:FHA domain-containing protein [Bacteroidaceae bacterium]